MALCARCETPLTLEINDYTDDDEVDQSMDVEQQSQTVPDDVGLACDCHFHWQCLLDAYELEKCPNCSQSIAITPASSSLPTASAPQPEIRVNLHNEGGIQQGLDIFPILKEESYLRAYPEERKCRAFLEFCREGDHRAIAELLLATDDEVYDDDDDDDDDTDAMKDDHPSSPRKTPDEILRYQDPIGDMESGLHAAVANGHREVVYLLLLLASSLPEIEFPALVYQEAAALGVMRGDFEGKVDIRTLRDAHGRSAEDVARTSGPVWNGWIGNGTLTAT
ncbi:hypothetical protein K431DRAFT_284058 [Polychaeton citri CBS 116435]|uniref:Uncharacterized protein n=1 Tax=Polychaeton citri CBS 116435 TaxID=1314669 RepID=A0A9P4QCJ1_9PEZI|nr:hypothetical protein K431DRAFT_284058 [Polychaeton citri CBS 116435]